MVTLILNDNRSYEWLLNIGTCKGFAFFVIERLPFVLMKPLFIEKYSYYHPVIKTILLRLLTFTWDSIFYWSRPYKNSLIIFITTTSICNPWKHFNQHLLFIFHLVNGRSRPLRYCTGNHNKVGFTSHPGDRPMVGFQGWAWQTQQNGFYHQGSAASRRGEVLGGWHPSERIAWNAERSFL